MTSSSPRFLLKLSGEILAGSLGSGLCPETLQRVAEDIAETHRNGLACAIVVGGGNWTRGAQNTHAQTQLKRPVHSRETLDSMGMLGTIMNGLALQTALEHHARVPAALFSALSVPGICPPYMRSEALARMQEKHIVILAAGTGNPYFTTDTAAILRALELKCPLVLKGTKTDGVYEQDPALHPESRKYTHLNYQTLFERDLRIMDMPAMALAHDNRLRLRVFSILEAGNLNRVAHGEGVFTAITPAQEGVQEQSSAPSAQTPAHTEERSHD